MVTFADFLKALQGPLIQAALGVALSFVVEWWPRWETLAPRVKRVAMLAICLAVPLLAAAVAVLLGYQANTVEATWWPAVVAGAAAFSASTLAATRRLAGSNES